MEGLRSISLGDTTPQTDMAQLALTRAGFPVSISGEFDTLTESALKRFQSTRGLVQDGIAGSRTWTALKPYLTGSMLHTVKSGDTMYKLAAANASSVKAIKIANPSADANNLHIGSTLAIPLWFDVVPTDVRWCWPLMTAVREGLEMRYPHIRFNSLGKSVMGREILCAKIGAGSNEVFYNASHHANEWITTPVTLKFFEEYAHAYAYGDSIFGFDAGTLFDRSTLYIAPLVNPDGVDLVTGDLTAGVYFQRAKRIADSFPSVPFPDGWKANIEGVDLNLQYPAGWDEAREIKFSQGWNRPAPRDYPGTNPLEAPEPLSLYNFTLARNFSLTLSYHTQGEVIYWQYGDSDPPRAYEIGLEFQRISGYRLESVPTESANAGYKDWFIDKFFKPAYTIEAGSGSSPLPIEQFEIIYRKNRGILTTGLIISI